MKTFTKFFYIAFICIGWVVQLQAQSNPSLKLGNASEVKTLFEAKAKEQRVKGNKAYISHIVPGQSPLVLNLKSTGKKGAASLFYGEVSNTKNSNFYLKVDGNDVSGSIMIRDKKKYYEYSSSPNGLVYLTERDIDKVVCVTYQESPDNVESNVQAGSVAAIPNLESFPGAEAVVLLDFDGQTVSGSIWNSQFTGGTPIVAAPASLTESEILEVWKMMSEDFRPFAINVTTNEAIYNNTPANRRTRVIFTPTTYFYPNAGGVAYIGSFTWGNETPCWVFNSGGKYAGEAGSHEVGHTLNLVHDGRTSPAETYYYGHDSWAPIMGVGYYRPVVQWSKGEYPYANNTEDDLQRIISMNGFGYRVDDHGNTKDSATPIAVDGGGNVSSSTNKGLISTRTDVDVFSLTTSGGNIDLQVNPDPTHPNLDILLTLRNSAGSVLSTANPSTLAASLSQTLDAGTYYIEVDGVAGDLGANSDYASIGEYFISGTVPMNTIPVVSITSPSSGQSFMAPATISIAATASDADGTVEKVEFFNGVTKLGEDLTTPYTYSWSGIGAGDYTLIAKATDNMGALTTSSPVVVTVKENGAPIVSITSPTNGQTFTIPQNPIKIVADAYDADGTVEKVEFFNGSTKLGEDLTAPYTYSWRQPHIGSYHITAKATDKLGANTTSDMVQVVVIKPGKGNLANVSKASSSTALEVEELAELSVYPNPITAKSKVIVDLPTTYSEIKITLHELSTGKKISERTYNNTQAIQVDVSALTRGLYGITIVAEGEAWTEKLLVMP